MKFTLVSSLMAAAVSAAPTFNLVQPRAANSTSVSGSMTEACNIGYATQNGGTTGGAAGEQVTVSSLEEFKTAAEAEGAAIIIVDGTITGSDKVDITSDKTVIGASGSSLEGVGIRIKKASNVIVRNMKISKVLADAGDAVTVQESQNVWLDHLDQVGS